MAGLGSSGTTSRLHRVKMNSRRVTRALCVATLQRRRASCDVSTAAHSVPGSGVNCSCRYSGTHAETEQGWVHPQISPTVKARCSSRSAT